MAGFAGRILRVNLSSGEIGTEPLPEETQRKFGGGRGIGIKYLYDELSPGIDPLGEENKVLLLNGPLAGTNAQGVSKWAGVTKSPLTGCYGVSMSGGDFGAWLKFAGYDLIIIEGKAPRPVYLYITNDGCEIMDAASLWGLKTGETRQALAQVHGRRTRTACVGPAAEKLVRYAVIDSGGRSASRCGVGTVMGAKNLKAVAINADRRIKLADPETFKQLVKEQIKLTQVEAFKTFKEWGTTARIPYFNKVGVFPVRNYRAGQISSPKELSGEAYRKFRIGELGCYSCYMRCGKIHRVPGGPYAGATAYKGPEYESMWAFTGPIDSTCVEASIAASDLCNELGMDTISTGNSIGFAYELFERGIINQSDTDGLELTYGNHSAMVALVRKIGLREGFGDILAEGVVRAAKEIGRGAEAYAMHVKGLELPAYEPRAAKAHGLSYATANIGGTHQHGYAGQELFGRPVPRPVDPLADENKGDIAVFNQNNSTLKDIGINCSFMNMYIRPLMGKFLVAATGITELGDEEYLKKVSERIYNLERIFNLREGFERKDDTLPQRMLFEPLESTGGPADGEVVRKQDTLLDEYYSVRGWTREGIPTRQKIEELGLDYTIKDIKGLLK
ncbi:aldehyde ferredoxin oxidoreductase family protein [Chloroflexota bacterium]